MDRQPASPSQKSQENQSRGEWYVLLYSIGALVGLALAFHPSLTALQTTNCLVLSWLLALGALLVSILSEQHDDEQEFDSSFDDW